MAHSYEESKKIALSTILLLAAITVVEVIIALLAKGYIFPDFSLNHFILGGIMITLSSIKAYYIVYEFMHMKYEFTGLRLTVILPTALLIWAVIAFLTEGATWKERREINNQEMIDEYNSSQETMNTSLHHEDKHGDEADQKDLDHGGEVDGRHDNEHLDNGGH